MSRSERVSDAAIRIRRTFMICLKAVNGTVVPSPRQSGQPGRGCYICRREQCVEAALKTGRLARALRQNIADPPSRRDCCEESRKRGSRMALMTVDDLARDLKVRNEDLLRELVTMGFEVEGPESHLETDDPVALRAQLVTVLPQREVVEQRIKPTVIRRRVKKKPPSAKERAPAQPTTKAKPEAVKPDEEVTGPPEKAQAPTAGGPRKPKKKVKKNRTCKNNLKCPPSRHHGRMARSLEKNRLKPMRKRQRSRLPPRRYLYHRRWRKNQPKSRQRLPRLNNPPRMSRRSLRKIYLGKISLSKLKRPAQHRKEKTNLPMISWPRRRSVKTRKCSRPR